jgi:hypothetical protein
MTALRAANDQRCGQNSKFPLGSPTDGANQIPCPAEPTL